MDAVLLDTAPRLIGELNLIKDSVLNPREEGADALLRALVSDHVSLLRFIDESRDALPDTDNRLMCGSLLTAEQSAGIVDDYLRVWSEAVRSQALEWTDADAVDRILSDWQQIRSASAALQPLCVSAQGAACYAQNVGIAVIEHPRTVKLLAKMGYRAEFREMQALLNEMSRKTRKAMPDYPCSPGEGPAINLGLSCEDAGEFTFVSPIQNLDNDWAELVISGYFAGLSRQQQAAAALICLSRGDS